MIHDDVVTMRAANFSRLFLILSVKISIYDGTKLLKPFQEWNTP